jgi:hypothetical protein
MCGLRKTHPWTLPSGSRTARAHLFPSVDNALKEDIQHICINTFDRRVFPPDASGLRTA